MDIERLAIHEAGHGIAGVALGLKVSVVDVRGRTYLARWAPEPEPWEGILWKLAGPAAEALAFGTVHDDAAISDRVDAGRWAYDLTGTLEGRDSAVADGRVAARELLSEHWLDVERVALALLTGSGRLLAHDLDQIVRGN